MEIHVDEINFHPILKDVENIFWFFLLSVRTLSDDDIQNILKTKNSTQEGYASFNQMLDKFNKSTNLNVERSGNITTSKLNIFNEMVFIGKAMAILTYDFLSLSSYNATINQWGEFQLLTYIRNGAAHYNKFNLKNKEGTWKFKEDEVIKWNEKEINRGLHGKEVFNSFISIFDIFLLAKCFSDRLTSLDGLKK